MNENKMWGNGESIFWGIFGWGCNMAVIIDPKYIIFEILGCYIYKVVYAITVILKVKESPYYMEPKNPPSAFIVSPMIDFPCSLKFVG